jgi:hypothetical protein
MFQRVGEGLLQVVAKVGAGDVLLGGQVEAEDLTGGDVATVGVMLGDFFRRGDAGIIDDDDFIAGVGRADVRGGAGTGG